MAGRKAVPKEPRATYWPTHARFLMHHDGCAALETFTVHYPDGEAWEVCVECGAGREMYPSRRVLPACAPPEMLPE